MTYVIETSGLTKRFGGKHALRDLSLRVPQGQVFAYLGRNGAGKTTTIKLLMGLLRPSAGEALVLGVDTRRLGPREYSRIGYVSENQTLPHWMTVDELLAYCRSMYSSWDDALCARLRRLFDLPGAAKVKRLSRGMTAKLALVSSLAYRPELIMLDEPFSGLDPLAREELIRGLLEIVEQEKWTVFISSHDIHEVERLADWIGVLDEGELKLCEAADALRRRFREVEVVTESTAEAPVSPPISWINVKRTGRCIRFIESEYENKVGEERVRARIPSVKTIDTRSMTLRQIFLALAESYRPKAKEFER